MLGSTLPVLAVAFSVYWDAVRLQRRGLPAHPVLVSIIFSFLAGVLTVLGPLALTTLIALTGWLSQTSGSFIQAVGGILIGTGLPLALYALWRKLKYRGALSMSPVSVPFRARDIIVILLLNLLVIGPVTGFLGLLVLFGLAGGR